MVWHFTVSVSISSDRKAYEGLPLFLLADKETWPHRIQASGFRSCPLKGLGRDSNPACQSAFFTLMLSVFSDATLCVMTVM